MASAPARVPAGLLLGLLAIHALAAPGAPPVADRRAPLVVPSGAREAGDLVSFGRSIEVGGEVVGSVVATVGDVRVTGGVRGHVVVLRGDAVLAGDGRVDGDVLAVGGTVRFEGGATAARSVGGVVRSLDALEAAFVSELKTSPVAGASFSPLLVSFRIFLLFLWLVAGLAFLRFAPRRLDAAAALVPGRAVLLGALGASAVLTGLLLAAGLLLVLPAAAGLVLSAGVVALLYVAKLWGLSAVFLALGRRLLRNASRGGALFGDPAALASGLVSLGLVSLVPALGPLVWSVVSLVGIGVTLESISGRERSAALETRLGRTA